MLHQCFPRFVMIIESLKYVYCCHNNNNNNSNNFMYKAIGSTFMRLIVVIYIKKEAS